MKRYLLTILLVLLISVSVNAEEELYIFNDTCINELYFVAKENLLKIGIKIFRDSRGVILRCKIFENESYRDFYEKLSGIEHFLAKIKNPVIIEVHTASFQTKNFTSYKNWEVSTVIANGIETFFISRNNGITRERIKSIGYGEFLPAKNTPYNGGNYASRVDIIILCNISGE